MAKEKEYVYSEYTYNSKNPLARFAHRTRFNRAIDLVLEHKFNTILDFGAGDNKFLQQLSTHNENIKLFSYEPVMETESTEKIPVFKTLEEIGDKKFDVITCFETLEHFSAENQSRMLLEMHKRLEDNGVLIVSVPIEIGFPSLVKNIRRLSYGGSGIKDYKNAIKCFFGKDIPEIRNNTEFIHSHLGFNYKKLEKIILQNFKLKKKVTSPFKNFSSQFNSQIFFIAEKKV